MRQGCIHCVLYRVERTNSRLPSIQKGNPALSLSRVDLSPSRPHCPYATHPEEISKCSNALLSETGHALWSITLYGVKRLGSLWGAFSPNPVARPLIGQGLSYSGLARLPLSRRPCAVAASKDPTGLDRSHPLGDGGRIHLCYCNSSPPPLAARRSWTFGNSSLSPLEWSGMYDCGRDSDGLNGEKDL